MSHQEMKVDSEYCLDCRIASQQEYNFINDREYQFGWDGNMLGDFIRPRQKILNTKFGGWPPPKAEDIEY